MEAYERAIADGADFVGIDVVSTSDGVLICRPDITLDDNTNVASLSQFSGRKSMQVLSPGAHNAQCQASLQWGLQPHPSGSCIGSTLRVIADSWRPEARLW